MATRSRIGIELPNGHVRSVYCHWDGYPEHNGRILNTHYTQREDVEQLIAGGDISSLRTRQTWESNDREPQPLYYTERGEELEIEEGTFHSFSSGHSFEEYVYLFTLNDEWKVYIPGSIPVSEGMMPEVEVIAS